MEHTEIQKCSSCGHDYVITWIEYEGNWDEKRDSAYECPYCGKSTRVHLDGNEDVLTKRMSE